MKAHYLIHVDGEPAALEVEAEAVSPGRYRITIEGQEHLVERRGARTADGPAALFLGARTGRGAGPAATGSWAGVGAPVRRVQLDGRLPALHATVGDSTFSLRTEDAQRQRALGGGGRAAQSGPLMVRAPMPGRVVKLMVKAGDRVEGGQGLVVVEAMKMENELKAPQPGTIRELKVGEGQNVEAGAPLLILET